MSNQFTRREIWDEEYTPDKPPSEPCPYAPGTKGKVEAMRARAEAGESLWHELDQRYESNGYMGKGSGDNHTHNGNRTRCGLRQYETSQRGSTLVARMR